MAVVRLAALTTCRVLLLTMLMMASTYLCAQTFGLAVNSRGNEVDSQRVDALWRINLETGDAEYIGWTSFFDLEGLALDSEGVLLGVDDDSKTLVRVSQTTGLAIPVGGQVNRNNMGIPLSSNLDFGMALDCDGQAWVVSSSTQSLFRADLESGQLSRVGVAGSLGAPISDLAFLGDSVVGIGVGLSADGTTGSPNLYSIELESGQATLIGALGDAALPYNNAGLDFDAEGALWAVTDRRAVPGGDFPSAVLRIDPATGSAERVSETIVGLESLAVSPAAACDQRGTPGSIAVPLFSPSALLGLILVLFTVGGLQARVRLA